MHSRSVLPQGLLKKSLLWSLCCKEISIHFGSLPAKSCASYLIKLECSSLRAHIRREDSDRWIRDLGVHEGQIKSHIHISNKSTLQSKIQRTEKIVQWCRPSNRRCHYRPVSVLSGDDNINFKKYDLQRQWDRPWNKMGHIRLSPLYEGQGKGCGLVINHHLIARRQIRIFKCYHW